MLVYSSKNFDDFVERPALTLKQCCSSNPYAFKVDNNYYHAMKYLFKRFDFLNSFAYSLDLMINCLLWLLLCGDLFLILFLLYSL